MKNKDMEKIQILLNKKQDMFKKAFEALQQEDIEKSYNFFNIESSFTNSISDIIKSYIPEEEIKVQEVREVQEDVTIVPSTTEEDINFEDEEETIG